MTERRVAGLGLACALVLVLAQVGIGAGWSLTHDDPTYLELTRRCLEREKLLTVEETVGDPVAAAASAGTLRTIVEGGLVTTAIASGEREVSRLREGYAGIEPRARLDVRGRYVYLWLRAPSPTQRQTVYDCAY